MTSMFCLQVSAGLNRLAACLPDFLTQEERSAVMAKMNALQQQIRLLQHQADLLDDETGHGSGR